MSCLRSRLQPQAVGVVKGDLGIRSSGLAHLVFVPGIGTVIADPHVRNSLLLREWEGEDPSSTGPFPWGPSVYHSAMKCAARENQPVGLAWVAALTKATVEAHRD